MTKESVTKNKGSLRIAARSSSDRLHIVATNKGWSVKREGAIRATRIYKTKSEALSGAIAFHDHSAIVIHAKDGSIEQWPK